MTPFRPFQMKVMTFGFANAPPCFQQYMDKVFVLGANKNNMLMGKYNSQFSTPNHINTHQNKSMLTDSHEDASFIEF